MTQTPDNTRRFRNVSVGVLAIAAAVAALCCGGLLALFVLTDGDGVTAATEPTVKITKCQYADGDATVWFATTNNAAVKKSYWLRFAIKDAGGKLLGDAKGYVSTLDPGETTEDDVTIFHKKDSIGASCEFVAVVG